MSPNLPVLSVLVAAGWLLAGPVTSQSAAQSGGGDDPTNVVADQIRGQGYECPIAETAIPDESDSSPDEKAWILTCSNATYRVKLVPDMAAQVEKMQ